VDNVSEFKCISKLSTGGSYVHIWHDLPLQSQYNSQRSTILNDPHDDV